VEDREKHGEGTKEWRNRYISDGKRVGSERGEMKQGNEGDMKNKLIKRRKKETRMIIDQKMGNNKKREMR
jgi:hypothetical protein